MYDTLRDTFVVEGMNFFTTVMIVESQRSTRTSSLPGIVCAMLNLCSICSPDSLANVSTRIFEKAQG